jgi:hypothetical protein
MLERLGHVLAEKIAHPTHTVSANDVVQAAPFFQPWQVGDVPANHDRRVGQVLANQSAHLANLDQVRLNRTDADHVIGIAFDLLDEPLLGRKIQQRAWGLQVNLD